MRNCRAGTTPKRDKIEVLKLIERYLRLYFRIVLVIGNRLSKTPEQLAPAAKALTQLVDVRLKRRFTDKGPRQG
jgi:hypothetical protein